MKRKVLWLLLGVAVLCMPVSCVTGVMLLNVANPMAIAFLTSFTVRNSSGEVVYVTPIGTVGKEGRRRLLPLSYSSHFSLPASRASDFRLAPNQERRLTFDWDDVNFSEIALLDERGNWRQLVIDPKPTERQYRRPATDFFVIPALSELPEVTEAVRAAATRPQSRVPTLWILFIFGIVPPVLLRACLRRLRATRAVTIPVNNG